MCLEERILKGEHANLTSLMWRWVLGAWRAWTQYVEKKKRSFSSHFFLVFSSTFLVGCKMNVKEARDRIFWGYIQSKVYSTGFQLMIVTMTSSTCIIKISEMNQKGHQKLQSPFEIERNDGRLATQMMIANVEWGNGVIRKRWHHRHKRVIILLKSPKLIINSRQTKEKEKKGYKMVMSSMLDAAIKVIVKGEPLVPPHGPDHHFEEVLLASNHQNLSDNSFYMTKTMT